MNDLTNTKFRELERILKGMGRVIVAYSGGVDSTFLFYAAVRCLGEGALGVIARSPSYPSAELEFAASLAESFGGRFMVVDSLEMDDSNYRENPPDRCYYCKSELFTRLREIADREGIEHILEGSNLDDTGDFRPGMKAAEDMGARSLLKEVGLTKQEIRELSREFGLPTWNKAASACLSSRIPYGDTITREKLWMIERAETLLKELGFKQVRVRHHGEIARIEVPRSELVLLVQEKTLRTVVPTFKELGFNFVTLDVEGYRTGSMNESLRVMIPEGGVRGFQVRAAKEEPLLDKPSQGERIR